MVSDRIILSHGAPRHQAPQVPDAPGVPIVSWRANLTVGTLSMVLAEAEPTEVVTVATAWVSMPVALAGPAATRACCVAKAARPAPFTMLPPRPVCGGPGRKDRKSGAKTERGPEH